VSIPSKRSDEFRQTPQACQGYFVTAAIFSLAINLLYLAGPLFMLQVNDRVLSSGSEVTLLMLTIALLLAYLALAGLDAMRARVLTRTSIRLDQKIAPRVMTAIIDRSANFGGARSQLLCDFDTFRPFITGSGIHASWTVNTADPSSLTVTPPDPGVAPVITPLKS
jgi:ATP-binding cassette subfamily C protein